MKYSKGESSAWLVWSGAPSVAIPPPLAEQASLDRSYVSGIERGVRNPGIKVVIRLARGLGRVRLELVHNGKHEIAIGLIQLKEIACNSDRQTCATM